MNNSRYNIFKCFIKKIFPKIIYFLKTSDFTPHTCKWRCTFNNNAKFTNIIKNNKIVKNKMLSYPMYYIMLFATSLKFVSLYFVWCLKLLHSDSFWGLDNV